jgi:hypothetical protein
MTTLRITVDTKKNARLLTRILRNMNFVKRIEEDNNVVHNQFVVLKKMFSNLEQNNLFREINDPVKWQREIRDEW